MWSFATLGDEFFVTTRLRFKLDLTPSRESLLHFFEQVGRQHPELTRLRRCEDGGVVLDEQAPDGDERRFVRLDAEMLKLGVRRARGPEKLAVFAETVLNLAPCHLSLSGLDFDHMEMLFGFDLEFRGNQDELVANTLFEANPLVAAMTAEGPGVIDFQPTVGVTLSDDCETQAYLEVKSRTSAYEIRCGEYDAAALSVFLTLRRYWGFCPPTNLLQLHAHLLDTGVGIIERQVVPNVVRPLAAAIAAQS